MSDEWLPLPDTLRDQVPEVYSLIQETRQLIEQGEDASGDAVEELHTAAQSHITAAEQALTEHADIQTGTLDRHLAKAESDIGKVVDRLIRTADSTLLEGSGTLMNAGWAWPHTTDDMDTELRSGIDQAVLMRVPEFAGLLASDDITIRTDPPPPIPPPPTPGPIGPDNVIIYPDGSVQTPPGCRPGQQFWEAWGFPNPQACTSYFDSLGRDSTVCFAPCPEPMPGPPIPPPPASCPPPPQWVIDACRPGMFGLFDPATGQWTTTNSPFVPPGLVQCYACPDVPPQPPTGPPTEPGGPPTTPGPTGGGTCPAPVVQCPAPVINIPPCPIPEPTPPPRAGGPGHIYPLSGINNWDAFYSCDNFDAYIRAQGGPGNTSPNDIFDAITGRQRPIQTRGSDVFAVLPLLPETSVLKDSPLAQALAHWGVGVVDEQARSVAAIQNAVVNVDAAKQAALMRYSAVLTAASYGSSYRLTTAEYLVHDSRLAIQYLLPQFIIDQGAADDLYVRGLITDSQWECVTRLAGNLPIQHRAARDAKQRYLSPGEAATARRRGLIDDAYYQQTLRRNGVLDATVSQTTYSLTAAVPDTRELVNWLRRGLINAPEFGKLMVANGWDTERSWGDWIAATEFIPPYTDLIRMMVHDAFDETVIKDYKLDDSFGLKFQEPVVTWFEQQGIPRVVAERMWYSHWVYPAAGQAFEMMYRQRPDRPERVQWEANNPRGGDESDVEYYSRGPLVTTRPMVHRLLSVNDMNPVWVERLIDIAYKPITRTDAERAYELGVFGEDKLEDALLNDGYTKENAGLLIQFYREQKQRRLANATGVLTIRKVIGYYKGGALHRLEADEALKPLVINDQQRAFLLDRADQEMQFDLVAKQLAAVQRGWMFGLYTPAQLDAVLLPLISDRFIRERTIARWTAIRAAKLKEPRVAQLCQWRTHGLITSDQYYIRLRNLGYTHDDATRIVQVCESDWNAKRAEKTLKEQKAQQAEDNKSLADAFKLSRSTPKQLANWIAKLTSQLQAAQTELANRAPSDGGFTVTTPNGMQL